MAQYYLVEISLKQHRDNTERTSSIVDEVFGHHSSQSQLNMLYPDFCPYTNNKPTCLRLRSVSFTLQGYKRRSYSSQSANLLIPCACEEYQLDNALDVRMDRLGIVSFLTPNKQYAIELASLNNTRIKKEYSSKEEYIGEAEVKNKKNSRTPVWPIIVIPTIILLFELHGC